MTEFATAARDAFNDYLKLLGERQFDAAAAALERLSVLLEQMNREPTDAD